MRALKKAFAIVLVSLFLGLICVPSMNCNESSSRGTIYVDDDNTSGPWDGTQTNPYQYIQDGINAAINGDKIFVYSGYYHENILINKTIEIIGENKFITTIDAIESNNTITIQSDEVILSGFTIICKGRFIASISIKSNRNLIQDNIILHSDSGIIIENSYNNKIINNTLYNNTVGIYDKQSESTLIQHNSIDNVEETEPLGSYIPSLGVKCHNSMNTSITNNYITNNSYAGLHLASSTGLTIRDNMIYCNAIGIKFLSSFSQITNNTFLNNSNIAIWFEDVIGGSDPSNNLIVNNKIIGNSGGIYVSYSGENNTIMNNYIDGGGIDLVRTSKTFVYENQLTNCGIGIAGDDLSQWGNHRIENNTINGKTIRYYVDEGNIEIPQNTSQIFLVNCTNCTIHHLNFPNIDQTVAVAYSSDIMIDENNLLHNKAGIYLYSSRDVSIENNSIGEIYVYDSDAIKIYKNIISNGGWTGIFHDESDNSTLEKNSIYGNVYGILMVNSGKNSIHQNTLADNEYGLCINAYFGTFQDYCGKYSHNVITENNFLNNSNQLSVQNSFTNTINNNYWDDWLGHTFLGIIPFPKVIIGLYGEYLFLPWVAFDWHPAQKPFVI